MPPQSGAKDERPEAGHAPDASRFVYDRADGLIVWGDPDEDEG